MVRKSLNFEFVLVKGPSFLAGAHVKGLNFHLKKVFRELVNFV